MKHRAELEAEDGYAFPRLWWLAVGAAVMVLACIASDIWPWGFA